MLGGNAHCVESSASVGPGLDTHFPLHTQAVPHVLAQSTATTSATSQRADDMRARIASELMAGLLATAVAKGKKRKKHRKTRGATPGKPPPPPRLPVEQVTESVMAVPQRQRHGSMMGCHSSNPNRPRVQAGVLHTPDDLVQMLLEAAFDFQVVGQCGAVL